MRKGIPVSPGVTVGKAYCVDDAVLAADAIPLDPTQISAELARYETAREKTAKDLRALQRKVQRQIGHEEAAIFGAHEAILHDPAFNGKIRGWIEHERMTVLTALHRLVNHYTSLFARTKDEYIKERLTDVRDVVTRLSRCLTKERSQEGPSQNGPLILVANELLPSQVVALGEAEVRGIVTQSGSQTSHAAIIARSRGIPAVSGIGGIVRQVKTGDTIVVDGRDGHVDVNPHAESLAAYRKLEREFFHLKDALAENRDQPAVTADGERLELLANINNVSDSHAAVAMGACGVGLYRTEYLYLTHPNVPDEEEQLAAYREILACSPNHNVTIRTLDIGGDKTVPYLGRADWEANPFMGWRSIRLSFEHPELFYTQLRAVYRVAAEIEEIGGQVRLMFPMITRVEELRRVHTMVRRVCQQLNKEKRPYGDVPMGMMLEVPAAAISIADMLPLVDFVSIGSNDLVQYLLAADRDNPKVAHLYQPLTPAVLRVLGNVIRACHAAGKPVTLCGEMAGQPRAFVLLLGMGLTSFSTSPAFIPTLKELASHLTRRDAESILKRALTLKTVANIKRYMRDQMERIAPNIKLLDME